MSFYPCRGGGTKKPYYVGVEGATNNSSGGFYTKYYLDISDVNAIELIGYSGTHYAGGGLKDITVIIYGSSNTLDTNIMSSVELANLRSKLYTTKISSKSYAGKDINPTNPIKLALPTSYKSVCIGVEIPDYNFNGNVFFKVYPR